MNCNSLAISGTVPPSSPAIIANFLRQAPIDSLDVLAFSVNRLASTVSIWLGRPAPGDFPRSSRLLGNLPNVFSRRSPPHHSHPWRRRRSAVPDLWSTEHVGDVASLAGRLRPGGFMPFFMIVPEFPTSACQLLHFRGQIDRLYGRRLVRLDPVVLVKDRHYFGEGAMAPHLGSFAHQHGQSVVVAAHRDARCFQTPRPGSLNVLQADKNGAGRSCRVGELAAGCCLPSSDDPQARPDARPRSERQAAIK